MDEIIFILTKQDFDDLRMALESANVQGSVGAVRQLVVRLTLLRQKLEQQYEHSTSGRAEEHSDVTPDDDGNHTESSGSGSVGP